MHQASNTDIKLSTQTTPVSVLSICAKLRRVSYGLVRDIPVYLELQDFRVVSQESTATLGQLKILYSVPIL